MPKTLGSSSSLSVSPLPSASRSEAPKMEEESDSKQEALLLKGLAETRFKSSNLKSALKCARRAHRLCPSLDGLAGMITSLSILDSAAKSPPEYYKILQVEPFSHINVIKKQYKKLALALHPDKNAGLGSDDAFKVVGEAFQFLSDRVKRKEYDVGLRVRMQEEAVEGLNAAETFWTACSRCRLLHQFERKYLGHSLVCPSCRKSFKAMEVEGEEEDGEGSEGGVGCEGLKRKAGSVDVGVKRKVSSEDRTRDVELKEKVGGRGEIEASNGDHGGGSGENGAGRIGVYVGVKRKVSRDGRTRDVKSKEKVGSGGEIEGSSGDRGGGSGGWGAGRIGVYVGAKRKVSSDGRTRDVKLKEKVGGGGEIEGSNGDCGGRGGEWGGGRLRRRESRERTGAITTVAKQPEKKGRKAEEETMTLAEMKLKVNKKINKEKMKLKEKEKEKEKDDGGKKAEDDGEGRRQVSKKDGAFEVASTQEISKRSGALAIEIRYSRRSRTSGIRRQSNSERRDGLEFEMQITVPKKRPNLELEKSRGSTSKDLAAMAVVDSDFYDFDKDRVERSFKKGQVWAVYDDIDGQPRHYGLVNEVICINPFKVRLCWLDVQYSIVQDLVGQEKVGFHLSCGRFKVAEETIVKSVNIFSHVVDCERAAREIYRIYPKKGSVWAVFKEGVLDAERRNLSDRDTCCYDIVICLTTYSEVHGLSMAYLEKVDCFKTVFQRREIGLHAIRWLEKDGVNLFSHQIPARRLSGSDVPDCLKECWELDPASLPSHLLTTQSEKLQMMPCTS
ncbi:uncharacterized protein LOC115737035 isoform X1 [Rhodamnia argentea]|uniref:Uncharacterized protein LOC115737035 isoform X1 n=1 Tax=Rhodamnia argentea TaxID=178133 RepID=A0A8B8NQQ9_9MYRT|nr:uncharacterized protein LOC115737035 isoform X1 [Rhodamnia argentea]